MKKQSKMDLTHNDIYGCANELIQDLFRSHKEGNAIQSIDVDDLKSQLWDEDKKDYKKPYAWVYVSPRLGKLLQEMGMVVAKFGPWYVWGRTECDSISEDVIEELARRI